MSQELVVSAHLSSLLNSNLWNIIVDNYLEPAVASLEETALSAEGTIDDLRRAQGARILRDLLISALTNDANMQAES